MSTAAKPKSTRKQATSSVLPREMLSVIERTPGIRIHGDLLASAWHKVPAKSADATIPAGKFKATCLQLLDRAAQGETITITKRGKVVGRLVPPEPEAEKPFRPLLGRMKGQIRIHGDIVGPDFDAWKMR